MNKLFAADPAACTGCGLCVRDCVSGIIELRNGTACVAPESEARCIGCQHCLAICPEAAVTVCGLSPDHSIDLRGFVPDPANLDTLVRARRSVRQFNPEPVAPDLLERILETVSYAPTGVNTRGRRFTVIRDAEVLAEYRERCCKALVAARNDVPGEMTWLADLAGEWLDGGRDFIFRNAPHLLVATVEKTAPCAEVDGAIALSYFDLLAQAYGVGTVWAGMIYAMLKYMPDCRRWLDLPEDHLVGYAILFGMPAVRYARAAQYDAEEVRVVDRLS